MSYKYLYRIGLFGDCSTGKSIFLSKYTKNMLPISHMPTIGVDFGLKIIQTQNGMDQIKAQFWDTSGSRKFKNITISYMKGLAGAILFYNVGYRNTFRNIERWLSDVKKYNPDPTLPIMVIATWYSDYREVSRSEGEQFAKDNNIFFIEIDLSNPSPINTPPSDILQPLWRDIWDRFIITNTECPGIKDCHDTHSDESRKKNIKSLNKPLPNKGDTFYERTIKTLKEHHEDLKTECVIT